MQSEITVVERQGQFYVSDGEREFIIPRGAEGDGEPGAPSGAEGGTAPTGDGGVQPPNEGGQPSGGQPSGGQGFIDPYLEGVDGEVRDVVAERLERFRQDQDAQVTRRFDQMRQETEIPMTVYNALINDPVGTVQWIAERFQEDRGIDLRNQLLEQWQQSQDAGGQGEPDPNQPMTQAQIEEYLEQREQQRQQEVQRQQSEQQRIEQQTRTVHSWMDEAAKSYGLEFDDKDGQPDPLRTAIALQANDLHNSGQAQGKAAVEMVVEAMAKRFGTSTSGNNNGGKGAEPRTANGGSPPPTQDIDVADKGQRRARMLELFAGGQ